MRGFVADVIVEQFYGLTLTTSNDVCILLNGLYLLLKFCQVQNVFTLSNTSFRLDFVHLPISKRNKPSIYINIVMNLCFLLPMSHGTHDLLVNACAVKGIKWRIMIRIRFWCHQHRQQHSQSKAKIWFWIKVCLWESGWAARKCP